MIETIGEGCLASVGGLTLLRITVRKIFWVHEQRKLYIKLQATRRGYNINHAQPKAAHPVYTIPDDERTQP